MKFNANQAGLSLGTLFALMHLLWILVILLGFGQTLFDWWNSAHFLTDKQIVDNFGGGIAILGLIAAFFSGYATGWIFAAIWNFYQQITNAVD